jgi:hypothetical protein
VDNNNIFRTVSISDMSHSDQVWPLIQATYMVIIIIIIIIIIIKCNWFVTRWH